MTRLSIPLRLAAYPVVGVGDPVRPALLVAAVHRLVGEVVDLDDARVEARKVEDGDPEVDPGLRLDDEPALVLLALDYRLRGCPALLRELVLPGDERPDPAVVVEEHAAYPVGDPEARHVVHGHLRDPGDDEEYLHEQRVVRARELVGELASRSGSSPPASGAGAPRCSPRTLSSTCRGGPRRSR